VDITHTGHHRNDTTNDLARYKEQNFNTVLQTLGLRSNIYYDNNPTMTEVSGRVVGFDTDEILRVWRFDWTAESALLYEVDGDPVAHLKTDFHLVPYISGLSESMEQQYAVFNTAMPGNNIIFQKKQ
jgi:hypothetical protein